MIQKSKKILFICKGHQNIAGAQLYLKQVSSLFRSNEYELHFAFHKDDGLRVFDEIKNVCRTVIWEYNWRHLPFLDSFRIGKNLFKNIKPHLIIFNSSEDEILTSVWASFYARVPKRIMIVHWAQKATDLPLFRKKKGFFIPVPSRYSLQKKLIRALSYNLLTKVIFVNNITRKAYTHLYRISENRCVTIYNGVDVEAFSFRDNETLKVRAKLNVRAHDYMIFTAGNLTEIKGHKYLVSAVHKLVSKGLPIKCLIAGQGDLKEALEQQILKMGLENNVTLLGYRNDIPSLLSAADIFCMPSLNEALGYSLLEAMASGVPVVASNVGGIPEVITHGKEGILVEPGDAQQISQAVEKVMSDDKLAKSMGSAGKKTVRERFSLEVMLGKTDKLFKTELDS